MRTPDWHLAGDSMSQPYLCVLRRILTICLNDGRGHAKAERDFDEIELLVHGLLDEANRDIKAELARINQWEPNFPRLPGEEP